MFYSTNGELINKELIEKFSSIESSPDFINNSLLKNNIPVTTDHLSNKYFNKDEVNKKIEKLEKKIENLSNQNNELKKELEEISQLTNRLEVEKADYFYLNNN